MSPIFFSLTRFVSRPRCSHKPIEFRWESQTDNCVLLDRAVATSPNGVPAAVPRPKWKRRRPATAPISTTPNLRRRENSTPATEPPGLDSSPEFSFLVTWREWCELKAAKKKQASALQSVVRHYLIRKIWLNSFPWSGYADWFFKRNSDRLE